MLHVFETCANPNGLCCLCSHSTSSNLVYLSRKIGHVCVVDLANTEKPPVEIDAHEAAISCMALSIEGNKLATSSVKVDIVIVVHIKKTKIFLSHILYKHNYFIPYSFSYCYLKNHLSLYIYR